MLNKRQLTCKRLKSLLVAKFAMGSLEAFLTNGISSSSVEGWLTKSLLDSFQSDQDITTNDSLVWDNSFQSEQDITANDSLVWDNREKHSLSCDLQHWLASFPGSALNNLIATSRDILTGITENTPLAFITDNNLCLLYTSPSPRD